MINSELCKACGMSWVDCYGMPAWVALQIKTKYDVRMDDNSTSNALDRSADLVGLARREASGRGKCEDGMVLDLSESIDDHDEGAGLFTLIDEDPPGLYDAMDDDLFYQIRSWIDDGLDAIIDAAVEKGHSLRDVDSIIAQEVNTHILGRIIRERLR